MKIGYIVLCHKEPDLVARIVNKVTLETKNIAVIHVDGKVDDTPFRKALESNCQALFVQSREKIYWGGWNAVVATMVALKIALENGCERYVLLQGADYPLHSNEYINDFFEAHKDVEYLKAYNITSSPRKISYMKSWGYHIYDGVDRGRRCPLTFAARGFEALNKLGIKYRRGYYYDKKQQKRYDIYWGWAHFALTRQCVEYILSEYQSNDGMNRYFYHTFPADETYLQTVVYNSLFAKRTADGGAVDEQTHSTNESMLNLTYFEYPGIVKVYKKFSDVSDEVKRYLYIRKISAEFISDA